MATQGLTDFSTLLHAAEDTSTFESEVFTTIRATAAGNLGRMTRLRAAWSLAKVQNPNPMMLMHLVMPLMVLMDYNFLQKKM